MKQYHTVLTVQKSNRKVVEPETKSISLAHIIDAGEDVSKLWN